MKKAPLPTYRPAICLSLSLSLSLLLLCSPFSSAVFAEGFLCQATQNSAQDLPMLEKTCPIGEGVWGKKIPQGENQWYWIQCGLLPTPMPLTTAKSIYRKISTDIWMKPELKGYRCLIGPYQVLSQAMADLKGVKTLPSYKDAFVRVLQRQALPSPRTSLSVIQPLNHLQPATPEPDTQSKSVLQAAANASVEIRLQTSQQGKMYVVPYLLTSHSEFYMEHGKPWNRVNYDSAQQVCQQLNMELVTPDEFKRLRASGVMEQEQWPLQLPYWGQGKRGLFAERASNQLAGTSLLNVMCVK